MILKTKINGFLVISSVHQIPAFQRASRAPGPLFSGSLITRETGSFIALLEATRGSFCIVKCQNFSQFEKKSTAQPPAQRTALVAEKVGGDAPGMEAVPAVCAPPPPPPAPFPETDAAAGVRASPPAELAVHHAEELEHVVFESEKQACRDPPPLHRAQRQANGSLHSREDEAGPALQPGVASRHVDHQPPEQVSALEPLRIQHTAHQRLAEQRAHVAQDGLHVGGEGHSTGVGGGV